MAKKLIVGNWKMNPETLREARELFVAVNRKARAARRAEVVVCPPAVFLASLAEKATGATLKLGAQDAFSEVAGAYTGFTSPLALRYLGVSYVIIGHSERRAQGETDIVINQKLKTILKLGLKTILCVGESERDNQGAYLEFIKNQLEADLYKVPRSQLKNLVVAYEPIWAIGEGAKGADTPEAFVAQAIYIRKILSGIGGKEVAMRTPVLYGGSVNPKNALALLSLGKADGFLVGRASLAADQFGEIIHATNHA